MPNTSVSSYALPSEMHLGHGASGYDQISKSQRVQDQVRMRMIQNRQSGSTTVPRANGSVQNSASSEYRMSSGMKYATVNPAFSSKSHMYSMERKVAGPPVSQYGTARASGWSSRSAVEIGPNRKMSLGGRGGGGGGGGGGGVGSSIYSRGRDDMGYGYQTSQSTMRSVSRAQRDFDIMSMRSMQVNNSPVQIQPWVDDGEGSMISDHYAGGDGYGYSQVRTVSSNAGGSAMGTMRRTLSGTLASRSGDWQEEDQLYVNNVKPRGPAVRTLSRLNQNASRQNRMSMGSVSGSSTIQQQKMGGGNYVQCSNGSYGSLPITRAMSTMSLKSMTKGMDTFDGQEHISVGGKINDGFSDIDMHSAVEYLVASDPALQVLGAAYIQHECYNSTDAKNQAHSLKAIPRLVKLFNYPNQEVQRYATGAMRNLIYDNMQNKTALIAESGIPQLIEALREPDDELRKNVTGILWNLSSKDNLKDKLASETLSELTERVLVPLSQSDNQQSASESEIFYNTTGCLRNLSSVNEKVRQQMRECRGLVDSLVSYIQRSVETGKAEDKGVENAVCTLRNLSFQLYTEIPPSASMRLEGPSRRQDEGPGDVIGCFTPQSKKTKKKQVNDQLTFSEVAKDPKGMEWLWHPQIVSVYNRVLQRCEINSSTREAAAGALQNITAGDKRWAAVLSRVAMEQERILPTILDNLRTNNDQELRSLTGFLRNLSRYARNKDDMATKVVNNLLLKLPSDSSQTEPSSDVIINICGVLNNLVMGSSVAARDIAFFDGLQKLVPIKNNRNSASREKAAKAAMTVLGNMYHYNKLHRDYKLKGFRKEDFIDTSI
ncbi:plakophilin-3-like isoform X2 [Acipenser ruthenus]|uniref:plakophilin-3-like isoform X2 n=1 Tax=Acipenser ruthenus TaxID=7906 RepID=UPI00274130BE|nr:plakophilin-3-like isoform X2 [Acipenser ruthenus]